MKKFIVLSIIFLLLVGCTTVPLTMKNRVKAFAREYFPACPPLEAIFADVEVIAFVCDDGQTITFSSYKRHSINFGFGATTFSEDIEKIKLALFTIGKGLSNVNLVIHNHFKDKEFSPNDKLFYFELRRNGFRGAFAIYYVPTKEIIGINDK